MTEVQELNVLIIAGRWNAAIFTPEWISKYLLPNQDLDVQVPENLLGSMRVSTKDIRISVANNRLFLTRRNTASETLHIVGEIAVKVSQYLPHTPIQAFGINFLYEESKPDVVSAFHSHGESEYKMFEKIGLKIDRFETKTSFTHEDSELILTIGQAEQKMKFDFNFHFTAKDLTEFQQKFEPTKITSLRDFSVKLLEDVYALQVHRQGDKQSI